jgi:ADP-ribosyl-[dinitrogen reductase] hydrolase
MATDNRPFLDLAEQAAAAAGALLRAALRDPTDPARAFAAAEVAMRDALAAAFPTHAIQGTPGSACAPVASADPAQPLWLLCADDDLAAFSRGQRGGALSITLLRDASPSAPPLVAVVYAYAAPDDAGDLIAWAAGCGPIQRDHRPSTRAWPQTEALLSTQTILTPPDAEDAPAAWSLAVSPARFLTSPSFAYRMARVAVGDADLAVGAPASSLPPSRLPPASLAAARALLAAAGGTLHTPSSPPDALIWGGAPLLIQRGLPSLPVAPSPELLTDGDLPPCAPRPGSALPLSSPPHLLSRAQGCLLGLLVGDSLGAVTKGLTSTEIARHHLDGPRTLTPTLDLLAGQPSATAEQALTLARFLAHENTFDEESLAIAYARWYATDPIDTDEAAARALFPALNALDADPSERSPYRAALAAASRDAETNGALARVAPLGIWGHHLSVNRVILYARADAEMTHPGDITQDASALFAATLAFTIRSGASPREVFAFADTTASHLHPAVKRALSQAVRGPIQPRDGRASASSLLSLHNAFYQLLHAPNAPSGIVDTIRRGGDSDTNAAIAGALLGAVHGLRSLPLQWLDRTLSCRPSSDLPDIERPRPRPLWPTDALFLSEALLGPGQPGAGAAR